MATRSAPGQQVRERGLASWQRLKAADLTGYLAGRGSTMVSVAVSVARIR
jgi:hypothetical protein